MSLEDFVENLDFVEAIKNIKECERYNKRNKIINRNVEDVSHEKELVQSNRILSGNYLKKYMARRGKRMNLKSDSNGFDLSNKDQMNQIDKSFTYCYLCATHAHIHPKTKQIPTSQRRYLKPYVKPLDLIKVLEAQQKQKDSIEYLFTVKTGPYKHAGTTSRIFFNICGERGYWGRFELKDNDPHEKVQFTKDSEIKVRINGPNIGDLFRMKIWHEGYNIIDGWYLEYIKVTNCNNDKSWYFECYEWISKHRPPFYNLSVTLNAANSKSKRKPEIVFTGKLVYHVKVFTGDKGLAGTDANVFIKIYGKKGKTSTFQLNNDKKDLFERGETDEFELRDIDIGELEYIKIWHDNSGFAPEWLLNKVAIKREKIMKEVKQEDTEREKRRFEYAKARKREIIKKRRPHSVELNRKKDVKEKKRSSSANVDHRSRLSAYHSDGEQDPDIPVSILRNKFSEPNTTRQVTFNRSNEYLNPYRYVNESSPERTHYGSVDQINNERKQRRELNNKHDDFENKIFIFKYQNWIRKNEKAIIELSKIMMI